MSRDALQEESDDDPFKAQSDDEDQDDEDDEDDRDEENEDGAGLENEEDEDEDVSEESEEEKPKQKQAPSKKSKKQQEPKSEDEADGMETGSDDDEGSEDSGNTSEDDDMDSDEDDEDKGDDDEDEDREKPKKGSKLDDREKLRQLMATDQKTIASSISQAAKADAVKGKAVKQQRSTFDSLLNTRIKLQKGLTAVSQLSVAAKDADNVDGEAVKSAEAAALTLWSTLEDLRYTLADAQSGDSKKRKRPSPVSSSTSSESLWKRMADLEADSVAHRRSILDKWSLKVRGSSASLPNARGKLLGSGAGGQQTITAVLDAQLASETGDRSAKRARKQANANGSTTDGQVPEPIYDDTIFYQTLLRELVEQRISSDSITNGLDTLHLQLPSRLSLHPVTGMRNDKNRRPNVDSRASKGRKMRYDVHEKLQNFMAPEDRGTWTSRARDEFFASLLGRTASGMLGEGDEASSGEESEEDREEGGLRLFRS